MTAAMVRATSVASVQEDGLLAKLLRGNKHQLHGLLADRKLVAARVVVLAEEFSAHAATDDVRSRLKNLNVLDAVLAFVSGEGQSLRNQETMDIVRSLYQIFGYRNVNQRMTQMKMSGVVDLVRGH